MRLIPAIARRAVRVRRGRVSRPLWKRMLDPSYPLQYVPLIYGLALVLSLVAIAVSLLVAR
jgi:hypothetical protein